MKEHDTRGNLVFQGPHWHPPESKRVHGLPRFAALVLCLIGLAFGTFGCTTYYYQVTDLNTGKLYFTEDMFQKSGAVHLKDGKTGNAVTLQNSDVREITKEEFETRKVQP